MTGNKDCRLTMKEVNEIIIMSGGEGDDTRPGYFPCCHTTSQAEDLRECALQDLFRKYSQLVGFPCPRLCCRGSLTLIPEGGLPQAGDPVFYHHTCGFCGTIRVADRILGRNSKCQTPRCPGSLKFDPPSQPFVYKCSACGLLVASRLDWQQKMHDLGDCGRARLHFFVMMKQFGFDPSPWARNVSTASASG